MVIRLTSDPDSLWSDSEVVLSSGWVQFVRTRSDSGYFASVKLFFGADDVQDVVL